MDWISGARAVTTGGLTGPVSIGVEGGLIVEVWPTDGPVLERILAPGFVDLQVNGMGAVDVATADGDDWDVLDGELLAHGVTTWCPTLVTRPLDAYAEPLARLAEAATRPTGAQPAIAGVHLEGPFLGGAPGAHPPDLIREIDLDWVDALPPVVRIVTLAPEQRRAPEAVARLFQGGRVAALGHSTASYQQSIEAIDAGAQLVTHCFNGMAPLHHREPGLVGAALADPRVSISIIADNVHVHPAVLSLAWRAKGPFHVLLVSDSVACGEGLEPGPDGAVRLPDGTLAGTTTALDAAVANAVLRGGIPLEAAVQAASTNPARLLGLQDRGRLVPGCRADIVALGPDLGLQATWVAGQQVV